MPRVAKKKPKSQFNKADRQRVYGNEPVINKINNEFQLVELLNWYSYNDTQDNVSWVADYMKDNGYSKEDVSLIRSSESWRLGATCIALCRLANNETALLDRNYTFIKNKIKAVLDYKKSKIKLAPKIIERVAEKTSNIIGDVEELIDNNGNVYEFLQSNSIAKVYTERVIGYYQPVLDELRAALKDKTIAEGYKNVDLKKRIAVYEGIISSIKSHSQVKTAVRKPRKKRTKSASAIVSKINYLKESPQYKVASINPALIVGAQTLWVFNNKYRKLGVYIASGPQGLSMKGTTIQGFDEEKSVSKTVRKTQEVLTKVLSDGKVALRKLLSDIKATETKLTGRINNETILLRVY